MQQHAKSTAETARRSTNSRREFFPITKPGARRAYFLRLASSSLGAAAFALQDAAQLAEPVEREKLAHLAKAASDAARAMANRALLVDQFTQAAGVAL